MLKTIIYVDGLNLYHGLLEGKSYEWIDPKKLYEKAASRRFKQEQHELNVVGVKYFMTPFKGKRELVEAQNRHRLALEAQIKGFEYHPGEFRERNLKIRLDEELRKKYKITEKIMEIKKNVEKGTDVNIATHLLNDAWLGYFDRAVLITNDADLANPLKLIKEQKHFSAKKLILISTARKNTSTPAGLKSQVDFTYRIDNKLLRSAQLPDHIEGTNIRKPDIWR